MTRTIRTKSPIKRRLLIGLLALTLIVVPGFGSHAPVTRAACPADTSYIVEINSPHFTIGQPHSNFFPDQTYTLSAKVYRVTQTTNFYDPTQCLTTVEFATNAVNWGGAGQTIPTTLLSNTDEKFYTSSASYTSGGVTYNSGNFGFAVIGSHYNQNQLSSLGSYASQPMITWDQYTADQGYGRFPAFRGTYNFYGDKGQVVATGDCTDSWTDLGWTNAPGDPIYMRDINPDPNITDMKIYATPGKAPGEQWITHNFKVTEQTVKPADAGHNHEYCAAVTHQDGHGNWVTNDSFPSYSTRVQTIPSYLYSPQVDPRNTTGFINLLNDTQAAFFDNNKLRGSINLSGTALDHPFGVLNFFGGFVPNEAFFTINTQFVDARGSAINPDTLLSRPNVNWTADGVLPVPAPLLGSQVNTRLNFATAKPGKGSLKAELNQGASGYLLVHPKTNNIVDGYLIEANWGGVKHQRDIALWTVSGTAYGSGPGSSNCAATLSTQHSPLQFSTTITGPALSDATNSATFLTTGNNALTSNTTTTFGLPQKIKAAANYTSGTNSIAAGNWPASAASAMAISTNGSTPDVFPLASVSQLVNSGAIYQTNPVPVLADGTDTGVDATKTFQVTPHPENWSAQVVHNKYGIDWPNSFSLSDIQSSLPLSAVTIPSTTAAGSNVYSYLFVSAQTANGVVDDYPPVFYGVGGSGGICSKPTRVEIEGDIYSGDDIHLDGIVLHPLVAGGIQVVSAKGDILDKENLPNPDTLKIVPFYTFRSREVPVAQNQKLALSRSLTLNRFQRYVDSLPDTFNLDKALDGRPEAAANSCDLLDALGKPLYKVCYTTELLTGEKVLVVRDEVLYLNPTRTLDKNNNPTGPFRSYLTTRSFTPAIAADPANPANAANPDLNNQSNPEGRVWFTKNHLIVDNVGFAGRGTIISTKTISVQHRTTYVMPRRDTSTLDQNLYSAGLEQQRLNHRTSVGLVSLAADKVCLDSTGTMCDPLPGGQDTTPADGIPDGWGDVAQQNTINGNLPSLSRLSSQYDFNNGSIIKPIMHALSFYKNTDPQTFLGTDAATDIVGLYFAPRGSFALGNNPADFTAKGVFVAGAFKLSRPTDSASTIFNYDRFIGQIPPPGLGRLIDPDINDTAQ